MAEDLKDKATEMMKKVLTVGIGTAFLTEEALRGMISEWKLPKEVITAILESSRKTKNDLLQALSQDILAKVADKVDPMALLEEFLQRNEIELNIKLGFKPRKADKPEASEKGE